MCAKHRQSGKSMSLWMDGFWSCSGDTVYHGSRGRINGVEALQHAFLDEVKSREFNRLIAWVHSGLPWLTSYSCQVSWRWVSLGEIHLLPSLMFLWLAVLCHGQGAGQSCRGSLASRNIWEISKLHEIPWLATTTVAATTTITTPTMACFEHTLVEHVKVGIQEGAQWVGGRSHLSILAPGQGYEDIRTARTENPDSVGKAHLTHVFVGPLVGADCGGQSGEGQVVGAFGSWERSACSCRMLRILGTHETDAAYVPEISAFVHQSMCWGCFSGGSLATTTRKRHKCSRYSWKGGLWKENACELQRIIEENQSWKIHSHQNWFSTTELPSPLYSFQNAHDLTLLESCDPSMSRPWSLHFERKVLL